MEAKRTSHQRLHFTDGAAEARQREWTCPSPLFSQAMTSPGPDKSPDRQPSPLSSPPRLMFQTAETWRLREEDLAARRGESQVQITSTSQVAKKEVETIFPSHSQVALLQEATEKSGRLTSLRKTSTSYRDGGTLKDSGGSILASSYSPPQNPFSHTPHMMGRHKIPSGCNLAPQFQCPQIFPPLSYHGNLFLAHTAQDVHLFYLQPDFSALKGPFGSLLQEASSAS